MSDEKRAKAERAQEIWSRAAAIVGADNMAKLTEAGLVVAGAAEFSHFVNAHAQESARLRELLAASEHDRRRVSARAQLIVADDKIAVLVTAPSCDEARLGRHIAMKLEPVVRELAIARFDARTVPAPEPAMPLLVKGGKA